ncbi:hypothetical protein DYY66_2136 [Candidatus Nitrosotalea sp. FS]|uniref:hypothetical protein n=1 Tax=Candidatus Nitrosotalea sp. FS TaxID=2341021 RepID=UPI0014088565|nr:hypothetical protein [Candidatus Nitrosotalea sp. FS]NHH97470.1 hypothetical protein [Candidatus Nitrosotalea sp. FS]
MKTIHLSKFSVFIITILIVAFVSFGVVVYSSPSSISNQNERIYLHTPFSNSDFNGYVKIEDMKPNSAGIFMYPSSVPYGDRANAYQTFMLIRLPKILGGDKNDTSSFRAYSALDPTSHCLMKYWPQDGRQRIEDPCISQPYRSIDGVSYNPGLTMIRAPTTGALPKLDLDVDNQGYLVIKPPTWTENKNGVVGIGRDVSKDEILQSSKILLNSCKNQMTWLALPVELQTGDVLIDMTCKSDHLNAVYTNTDYTYISARVDVTFCNCTKTPNELGPWINSENGQLWNVSNTTIYVSGTALQTDGNKIDPRYSEYTFRFIKNGYEVFFTDMGSFDDSAKEVLSDFFNDKNISDLKRTA